MYLLTANTTRVLNSFYILLLLFLFTLFRGSTEIRDVSRNTTTSKLNIIRFLLNIIRHRFSWFNYTISAPMPVHRVMYLCMRQYCTIIISEANGIWKKEYMYKNNNNNHNRNKLWYDPLIWLNLCCKRLTNHFVSFILLFFALSKIKTITPSVKNGRQMHKITNSMKQQ